MVAGWFCEKSGWIGKVEDVKPVLFKEKWISTGNHFEEEDFLPGWIVNHTDFIRFDSPRARYHPVLGFRLFVLCRLVAVRWMRTSEAFASLLHFILSLHWKTGLHINAQVLGQSSLQWKRSYPTLWEKNIKYWPVQMTGNKFATGEILKNR